MLLDAVAPLPATLGARAPRATEKREKKKGRSENKCFDLNHFDCEFEENESSSDGAAAPSAQVVRGFCDRGMLGRVPDFAARHGESEAADPAHDEPSDGGGDGGGIDFVDDCNDNTSCCSIPPQIQRPDRHDPDRRRRGGRSIALEGFGTVYAPTSALRR
jgi:hypothetical protein